MNNLSEEEKNVIEQLKKIKKAIDDIYIKVKNSKSIDVILNRIEKQQKEIEEIWEINEVQEKTFVKYEENIDKVHENVYIMQEKEIAKKDKIIDLMADYIAEKSNFCANKCCMNEDCHDNDCIKQYFERKVEE